MLRFRELYEIWKRDNSLVRALNDSYVMLEATSLMFRESVASLRESDDGQMRIDIYREDQRINRYQQELRRGVLKHLAVTGGVNLVPGLVLTTVVIDIERIGDYTKNIMELAVAHPRRLSCDAYDQDVRKIETTVRQMFDRVVPVLRTSDKTEARTLVRENVWIRKRCDEIDFGLIRGEVGALSCGDAVAVALYVRYLKRVGAHLLNILSSVINPFDRIGFREEQDG
jgi:phosphate transport system protein